MSAAITHISRLWPLLDARVARTPNAPFVIDGATGGSHSFAAVRGRAEALAAQLFVAGVRPGDVVAWQLPTRLDTLVLSLALARLDVIQNPVLHLYRERELTALLSQSRPRWLVVPGAEPACDYPALAARVAPEVGAQVLVLGDPLPDSHLGVLPAVPTAARDHGWIYCTSGTTSMPKGVIHTDASLIAGGLALADAIDLHGGDLGAIAFPFAHIGGSMYLVMLLALGIPALLLERFVPAEAAALMTTHGVTVAGGSTAHYQAFLDLQRQHPGTPVLPGVRMFVGGGASKPAQLYYAVLREMGIPIIHSYGMTESAMVASNRAGDDDQALAHSDGRPVAGMEIRLVTGDGNPAAPGEEGEIQIRGTCLCRGYLDVSQTRAAFTADGYFRTGDLGRLDTRGYLSLTGRLKDIIIRKGENISAREIEELLLLHPAVAEAAVIGLPDASRGERVCAVVVPRGAAPDLGEFCDFLRGQGLIKQKLPEQLEVVACLPRSEALGKVAKQELRARFAG